MDLSRLNQVNLVGENVDENMSSIGVRFLELSPRETIIIKPRLLLSHSIVYIGRLLSVFKTLRLSCAESTASIRVSKSGPIFGCI
jgi:hypothetical protein